MVWPIRFDLQPADLSTAAAWLKIQYESVSLGVYTANKMMKSSTREGQMVGVTHSGVSVALPRTLPSRILAECRWGLWPGRADPSEERVMVDPGWQGQSREGSLLILFDLWSEPENETEPQSERYALLAGASGWSHWAQVRRITHHWLFLSDMS